MQWNPGLAFTVSRGFINYRGDFCCLVFVDDHSFGAGLFSSCLFRRRLDGWFRSGCCSSGFRFCAFGRGHSLCFGCSDGFGARFSGLTGFEFLEICPDGLADLLHHFLTDARNFH